MQAPAGVFFSNGDHQTQVGFRQLIFGLLIALRDALSQLHFLLGRQQLHLANLLQVHPHRVVQAVFCGQIHRIDELFLFNAPQIQPVVQSIAQAVAQNIQAVVNFQLGGDDLDIHGIEPVIDLFNFFRGQLHLFQDGAELRIPDHALFLALGNQSLHGGLEILGIRSILCRLFGCTHSQFPLYLCLYTTSKHSCRKTIPRFCISGKGFLSISLFSVKKVKIRQAVL